MAAAAPSYVCVKRKRDDAPIQSLVLEERQAKHIRLNVEYRLESVSQATNIPPLERKSSKRRSSKSSAQHNGHDVRHGNNGAATTQPATKPSGPRHFELTTGKRSADAAGLLPTFIERPLKKALTSYGPRDTSSTQQSTPQKRPGTKRTTVKAEQARNHDTNGQSEPSTALAASLHSFALAEAAADELGAERVKPRVIMQPKRTVRRRQPAKEEQIHSDPMDSDDKDFVYDIYIRSNTQAPPPVPIQPATATSPALIPLEGDSTAPRSLLNDPSLTSFPSLSTPTNPDIGFLHLPEEESEQSYFWSSNHNHMDLGSSSDDGAEDDEDSNAEDYYGADYPEDEVDGDDEMGVGEWRFRRGSDGEDGEDGYVDEESRWAGGARWGIGKSGELERLGSERDSDEEYERDVEEDNVPWR